MRNRDEKVDLLREMPLFADAHRRELRRLAAATDLVTAVAGCVLSRGDRRTLATYIVVDGTVDVVVQGTTVTSRRRGQIIGELGVVDGERSSADVVAATDVTLLEAHTSALRGLLATSPALRRAVLGQRTMDREAALRAAVLRLSVGV